MSGFVLFGGQVLTGWSGTYFIDQTGLEHRKSPALREGFKCILRQSQHEFDSEEAGGPRG